MVDEESKLVEFAYQNNHSPIDGEYHIALANFSGLCLRLRRELEQNRFSYGIKSYLSEGVLIRIYEGDITIGPRAHSGNEPVRVSFVSDSEDNIRKFLKKRDLPYDEKYVRHFDINGSKLQENLKDES